MDTKRIRRNYLGHSKINTDHHQPAEASFNHFLTAPVKDGAGHFFIKKENDMPNSKKYYIKNKEKILKYGSQWQKDNPEKVRGYVKKWKKNNPKKVKKQKRRYRKKYPEKLSEYERIRHRKKREYIQKYKLSKGCAICGYNKCAEALDFHHPGDKNFRIALSTGKNLEEIKKEIDKCIIHCANCHRELHAKENGKY